MIETQYFPSLGYFLLIKDAVKLILEEDDLYRKQEYRNRCYILGANKIESLTIPVHSKSQIKYSDVKVDYTQNWLKVHIRTIQSAYSNAPFFEHYFPLIEEVLLKRYSFLIDINKDIMTLCLKLLEWEKEVSFTSRGEVRSNQSVKDCRNQISIKKKDSIIEGILEEIHYQQLFGSKFVPNLSVIDLLFNEGINASDYFSERAYNKLTLGE